MQQVLEDANEGTFKDLASFARAQHSNPSNWRSATAGYHRLLPTALTVAGGVNSSDHARTFPDLVSLLRSQVLTATQALVYVPTSYLPTPSQVAY